MDSYCICLLCSDIFIAFSSVRQIIELSGFVILLSVTSDITQDCYDIYFHVFAYDSGIYLLPGV